MWKTDEEYENVRFPTCSFPIIFIQILSRQHTEGLHRPDPLGLRDFVVDYSLNKKGTQKVPKFLNIKKWIMAVL